MRSSFLKFFSVVLFSIFIPLGAFAAPILSGYTDASFVNDKFGDIRLVIEGSDAENAGATPVNVNNSGLTGHAFGDRTGWISFKGDNHAVDLTCNGGTARLSGYGWGENVGPIFFGPFQNSSTDEVRISSSGVFSGYAWAKNAGWIDFSGVRTSFECNTIDPPDDTTTCNLAVVPSTIMQGQSATLVWSTNFTDDAMTSGLITPIPGTVSTASGSVVVNPQTTTTYSGSFTSSDTVGTGSCDTTLVVTPATTSVILFDPKNYSVQEGSSATIRIVRQGSAQAAASAVIKTFNGSASAPGDYDAVDTTVSWAAGDSSVKTVQISTAADQNLEGSETVIVRIIAAVGTQISQAADTAVVTINEDIVPPTQAYLVIKKAVDNLFGGTAVPSDFTLTVNGQSVAQNIPIIVTPGSSYTLGEAAYAGYELYSITGSAECPSNLGQNFTIPAGSVVSCTVHNRDICTDLSCIESVCLDPQALNNNEPLPCIYDEEDVPACTGPDCDTNNEPNPNPPTKTIIELLSKVGLVLGLVALAQGLLSGIGSIADLLSRFGSILFGIFAPLRRKPWGIVYDSITKEPIDPAIVTVFDAAGNEIAQTTTDMYGRFGFLLKPGTYTLTAGKTHYAFPSQIVQGETDSGYESLYYGGTFTIEENAKAVLFNIPMDPLDRDWNQEEKHRMQIFRKQRILFVIDRITRFFFPIGFTFSLLALVLYPAWFNGLIFALYVINLVMILKGVEPKSYGSIIANDGTILVAARVSLYSTRTRTLIARRVTNEHGQYYMLVQPGEYYTTVEVMQPDGSYKLAHTSEPHMIRRGIFAKNIKLT